MVPPATRKASVVKVATVSELKYLKISSIIAVHYNECIDLLLLQLPSPSSGTRGALPTCSADYVHPVGFTGRSTVVLRPLLN